MNNDFYTILTNAGLAAIANASVNNTTVNFAKVAVGDGKGAYYTPTREMTSLRNQTWAGPVASVQVDGNNPNWINVETVIPATDGGFYIREMGIFNEEDVLLAIGKLPETYKPEMESGSTKDLYLKAIFEVTNANVITLKADPSVVLASKKYVDDKVALVSGELTTLQQQVTQHSAQHEHVNGELTILQQQVTYHLAQYEYQTATIKGTQIQLMRQSNSNRLLFKLEAELIGDITVSTDAGATSKNLVDIDGVQVTSIEKGFHEIVQTGNFFIIRNKGGLSKTDLEALITIVKEAEENESVLRTKYINTVNATDEKINLPSMATWNEILSQIPNIHSDKKAYHYMGGTASFENSAPYTMLNGNSVDFYFISVNIPFKPSSYIMYYTDLSNGQKGMVVYNLESNNFSVADTIQRFSNITDSSATDVTFRNFKANSRGIQFYDAGTLRIPINAASGSCEYTLYAYS